jgi:hypothetical protein
MSLVTIKNNMINNIKYMEQDINEYFTDRDSRKILSEKIKLVTILEGHPSQDGYKEALKKFISGDYK